MPERILRWESPQSQRYYAARVQQDLLGDWILACAWGGLHNGNGNMQSLPIPDKKMADAFVQAVHDRRVKHHYQLVSDRTV